MAISRKQGRRDSIKTYRMYRWKKIYLYLGGVVNGSKGYLSMHNSVYLYSNLNATEFAMTGLFWFLWS